MANQRLPPRPAFEGCILQPQSFSFFFRKLEHKIRRKTVGIAAHGKVEVFRERLVKLGQIGIAHNLLPADEVDPALNKFHGYWQLGCEGELFRHWLFYSCRTIGIRHPVPNAREVTLRAGAACFRFNSAARTSLRTRRTVRSSKPWAMISSADWHCSICSSRIWSSSS